MSSPRRGLGMAFRAALLVGLALQPLRAADESGIQLKPGPDEALTRARCSTCHSLDYIPMNSVFLKRANWQAEVRKMIRVMGAPVSDEEAARIVDYLTRNYGID